MNCGPVSIAPGPVSLNNDQRSQNFDNIRSGFEGQQKAPKPVISAPSPTPRNRSRSTKSPTPPRVSYETKPQRSYSSKTPELTRKLDRTEDRKFSRTPEPQPKHNFEHPLTTQKSLPQGNAQGDVDQSQNFHNFRALFEDRSKSPLPTQHSNPVSPAPDSPTKSDSHQCSSPSKSASPSPSPTPALFIETEATSSLDLNVVVVDTARLRHFTKHRVSWKSNRRPPSQKFIRRNSKNNDKYSMKPQFLQPQEL